MGRSERSRKYHEFLLAPGEVVLKVFFAAEVQNK